VGFETLADHIAGRADMPFGDYLVAGVLEPLGCRPSFAARRPPICTARSTI